MCPRALRESVKKVWLENRSLILDKISAFERRGKEGERALLEEAVFCLLTPQSRAEKAWECVEVLRERGYLCVPSASGDIAEVLRGRVRFHNQKARRIVRFLRKFGGKMEEILREPDDFALREFLVENVEGYGYKEATHFLRNVGRASDMAILDRHVLRMLKILGVYEDESGTLSGRKYLSVEGAMRGFSSEVGIPMVELDLVFWLMCRGSIFK